MPNAGETLAGKVAVVTGGGGGIGRQAALELARRGAAVVVVDNGAGVQGEPLEEPTAAETASRISADGGVARASTASVTDPERVRDLFREVVDDLGSLDIVVNAAGVIGSGALADATDNDWRIVLDTHVGGYVNVLAAALPIMAAAGHGRIVGFTSGVGLARTSEGDPAYGTAKRAVAALTWQIGQTAPPGIAVNALSPIAATRMVAHVLGGTAGGPQGLDLSAMPQPEDMAPAAAWLGTDAPLRGQVVFSAGPEMSLIGPPALIEGVRTRPGDLGGALDTLMPVVLVPADAQQATTGGSNPRFGDVWSSLRTFAASGLRCVVVTDDTAVGSAIAAALGACDVVDAGADPAAVVGERVDAVIPALVSPGESSDVGLLEAHRAVTGRIMSHAVWSRAASRLARSAGRPLRVVHVVGATTPAGRTVAQAVTQLARSSGSLRSFAVGLESADPADLPPLGELCVRLACSDDAVGVAGAELAVLPGWLALRRHPGPVATVSFGGPRIPGWVAEAFSERALRPG